MTLAGGRFGAREGVWVGVRVWLEWMQREYQQYVQREFRGLRVLWWSCAVRWMVSRLGLACHVRLFSLKIGGAW